MARSCIIKRLRWNIDCWLVITLVAQQRYSHALISIFTMTHKCWLVTWIRSCATYTSIIHNRQTSERNYNLKLHRKPSVSEKRSIFVFVRTFVKFPPIVINVGRKMAKWLKLYATYTFPTSPHLCHRTTLLNIDVPNCSITLEFITIRLRVRHPSVERPPYYSEEGTAAQVPKEDQCPRINSS